MLSKASRMSLCCSVAMLTCSVPVTRFAASLAALCGRLGRPPAVGPSPERHSRVTTTLPAATTTVSSNHSGWLVGKGVGCNLLAEDCHCPAMGLQCAGGMIGEESLSHKSAHSGIARLPGQCSKSISDCPRRLPLGIILQAILGHPLVPTRSPRGRSLLLLLILLPWSLLLPLLPQSLLLLLLPSPSPLQPQSLFLLLLLILLLFLFLFLAAAMIRLRGSARVAGGATTTAVGGGAGGRGTAAGGARARAGGGGGGTVAGGARARAGGDRGGRTGAGQV